MAPHRRRVEQHACTQTQPAASGAAAADTAHSLHCALSTVRRKPIALRPSVHRSFCPCCRCVAARCDRWVWSAGWRRSAHSGGLRFSGRRANPDQRPILTAFHFETIYLHQSFTHHTRGGWTQLDALPSRRGCALRALPCRTISTGAQRPLSGQPTRRRLLHRDNTNAHRLGAEAHPAIAMQAEWPHTCTGALPLR